MQQRKSAHRTNGNSSTITQRRRTKRLGIRVTPRKLKLAQKIIEFGSENVSVEKEFQIDLYGNRILEIQEKTNPRLHPTAFVFACIFDQWIKWQVAWSGPIDLEKRLGHLDPSRIASMTQMELEAFLRQPPKVLHRIPGKIAKWLIGTCKVISEKYRGKPENIWNDCPTTIELQERFSELPGFGKKKASMATNILVRDYQIPITGTKAGIDISYDVHVRRVFMRLQLVKHDTEDEIIETARSLNPEYPGLLDLPTWRVGNFWCHAALPNCSACFMLSLCPSAKRV